MEISNFLTIALVLFINSLYGQNSSIDKFLSINPSDIKVKKNEVQEYNVTLKWQNLDAINGNKINCNLVKAMVEDVILKLKSDLFAQEQIIDLQREIIFEKIQ